jgi:hypothetical protein
MLPDYAGGSLVNLMASLLAGCGAKARHPGLAALSAAEISTARNVVLLVIDGLGERYLGRCGAGGELARRNRGAITSVFPSTTASAITTTYTGCTPYEHGLTGWFSYFGEAGCVGAPLPFTSRGEQRPLSARGADPGTLFRTPGIFASLPLSSHVVTSQDIADSLYNLHHCAGAERHPYEKTAGLVEAVVRAVKGDAASGPGRKFVYAYWPEYDRTAHRYGAESREAAARLGEIDEAFGTLLARLAGTDSIVVATADHGFVDVTPGEALELPASLAAMLRFPLSGERRVAYCHVHAKSEFMQRARDWLGERAEVRESARLAAEGWFGGGTPHPRFGERIGDVALVMNGRYTVKDWVPGDPRHVHIGNHGGVTEDEMLVPLIVERT